MQHSLRNIACGSGLEGFDGNFLAPFAGHQDYGDFAGAARATWATRSRPDMPGMTRSVTIRAGCDACSAASAPRRWLRARPAAPALAQQARHQLAVHRRVIDRPARLAFK